MNILPKKRWHVRTKDNVARVRRDQAQAREEEERRLERVALAERESRTTLLRQRAAVQRNKEGNTLPTATAATSGPDEPVDQQGHVNFFADLEEQERTFGANKDYEKEKRLEKEAEERKIGLLKYLGEGSSEYMKETPWYQRAPKREAAPTKSTPITPSIVKEQVASASSVTSSDSKKKRPASKEKKQKKKRRRRHSSSSSSQESSGNEGESGKDNGGNHKHSTTGSTVDIEKLRSERLRREREERLKTEALLRRMRGEKDIGASKEQPKYEQRYSSQFNPDLARQNR